MQSSEELVFVAEWDLHCQTARCDGPEPAHMLVGVDGLVSSSHGFHGIHGVGWGCWDRNDGRQDSSSSWLEDSLPLGRYQLSMVRRSIFGLQRIRATWFGLSYMTEFYIRREIGLVPTLRMLMPITP